MTKLRLVETVRSDEAPIVGAPTRDLTLQELRDVTRRFAAAKERWIERVDVLAGERTYTDLHSSEHVGVWAISWSSPRHDTGFHGHHRSKGAVHVLEGTIVHGLLCVGGGEETTLVAAGDGFEFDSSVVHRMAPPSRGRTITIHAYSPPLEQVGQFDIGNHFLRRRGTSSKDHLEPQELGDGAA